MTTPTRSPLLSVNDNIVPAESPMSAKLHPFPPPTPEDATEDAPPPPPPLPASTDSTLATNHPIETVRAVAVPILFNEHPLSMPIWVGGNAAAAAAYLFGLNPLNAASWTLLACVMKGFALSVVSPPKPAPTPLTPEQLAAYAAPAAAALNSARDLGARVFRCTDPRLALRAALCFYAATLVSSRCSTTSLCWGGLNLAFLLPAALKAGVLPKAAHSVETKIRLLLAHPRTQHVLQKLQTHPQLATASQLLRAPKGQLALGLLAWFFCLSWFHKLLSAGFVCLHLKADGVITPATELQVGEAVDQIKKQAKKQARRMSLAGGALAARVGMATPPKPKSEPAKDE